MDKWAAIFLIALTGFMFGPVVVAEFTVSQCKTEAIKQGMSAEDILKLCK